MFLLHRSESEHESSRRMKTEFLVQLDGAGTDGAERILIVGATNRPQVETWHVLCCHLTTYNLHYLMRRVSGHFAIVGFQMSKRIIYIDFCSAVLVYEFSLFGHGIFIFHYYISRYFD